MADISFQGNIGNSELRFTNSGKALLSFSVAENHRKKDGTQWIDDGTTWWRVTAWEKQAEALAEHAVKGARVIVTGQVRSREYEKDGEKRTSYDVTARHVGIVPKSDAPRQQQPAQPADDPWSTQGAGSDEPPF